MILQIFFKKNQTIPISSLTLFFVMYDFGHKNIYGKKNIYIYIYIYIYIIVLKKNIRWVMCGECENNE